MPLLEKGERNKYKVKHIRKGNCNITNSGHTQKEKVCACVTRIWWKSEVMQLCKGNCNITNEFCRPIHL
jgi:hypothetical protein